MFIRALILLFLLTTISCGWHLRGLEPIPQNLSTVRLDMQSPNSAFGRALRRTLNTSGITLLSETDSPTKAPTLRLGNVRNERRAISTTDLGKAAEYELVSLLEYEVIDTAGDSVGGPESILTEKIYVFDQNNVASAAQEERLLRDEMQRELIQQLLRRYRAVQLPSSSP